MNQPTITGTEAQALLDALAAANELQCARSNPCPACVTRRAAAAALANAAAGLAASVVAHATAAREYLDAEDAIGAAWDSLTAEVDDATWVRVNVEIGAADIRRDAARAALAALV